MTCRCCLHWKRRTPTTGTCWLMDDLYPHPITTTHEADTCADFTPKVSR